MLYELADKLKKYPKLKRQLKNIYQLGGALLSDKKSIPLEIKCVSNQNYENLFGYYDKSPWNNDGTKMLYLRVKNACKQAASTEEAILILKDLKTNEEKEVAITNAWNVQQGCMLQWLGPAFDSKIIYNDVKKGKYVSIIYDVNTNEKKEIKLPVYTVSSKGDFALTLDFSRLHRLRPGYGYMNLPDTTKDELCPKGHCIWKIDLYKNQYEGILTYEDLLQYKTKETMSNAEHKVNHIMLNPSGNRFMFLHRWIQNGVKYTRLFTANIDGANLYCLLDEDMVSHCNWKDDETIIAWAHTQAGNHYYILKDKTLKKDVLFAETLKVDGHPSFSPDGKYLVTDTYPDFKRKEKIFLCDIENNKVSILASIYSSIKFINETRCDLHPRWRRDSKQICFDAAVNKKRQVYVMNIEKGKDA